MNKGTRFTRNENTKFIESYKGQKSEEIHDRKHPEETWHIVEHKKCNIGDNGFEHNFVYPHDSF